MSESAPPDPDAVERELQALEEGVGRLLHEIEQLRDRASSAEQEHARLTGLLSSSGVELADPGSLEVRLKELTEENSRLKEVIREARTRAEGMRGRLIVMEDESAS
jgi:predicted RNase H-like nuclease (RuvC/YqgF family)